MLKIIAMTSKGPAEFELDSIREAPEDTNLRALGEPLVVRASGRCLIEVLDQFEGIPRPSKGVLRELGEEAAFVWRAPWAELIVENLVIGIDFEETEESAT